MISRISRVVSAVAVVAMLACFAAKSRADDFGSIKGHFTFDGPAPTPAALDVNKDQATCGNHNLVDQSIEVGAGGGLANVIIWLRDKKPMANPDFDKSASDKITLDNKNCHFIPHVVGVRVGQTLVIKNSDPIAHNTKIDGQNLSVNPLIPAGQSSDQSIDGAENLPAPVSCSIHGWMHGWLVVRPNPYFAISDKDGNFEIKGLPAGEHEFQVWQEKAGYITDVSTGGQSVEWVKGRVKWTVEGGKTTDLGDFKLAAAQFNKAG